jgi:hypothetical protein
MEVATNSKRYEQYLQRDSGVSKPNASGSPIDEL